MGDMLTTEYDGCGRCMVGVRRLSRKTDATSSPARQGEQVLAAVAGMGGHVIAWADDWEVSGATNPLERKGFGPWLRGEMGPYDGVASASVDRVGRNVRDTLNTQELLTGQGRLIVTADHTGVWDFHDPNQENEWMAKAWGSQMELRAIQKRNRDETLRARAAGQPRQMPSYGYQYIRLVPMGKVDHVEIDPVAAGVIREVARRLLADGTGTVTAASEAARLTRAGVASPSDRRAELYGRPRKGGMWNRKTLHVILTSPAALGYLIHDGRPVIGPDGEPVRLAEPLWDRATHDALVEKLRPRRDGARTQKGTHLLSGLAFCGACGRRLYIVTRNTSAGPHPGYGCNGRVRGVPASQHCKPAPTMATTALDTAVGEWFLARYGSGQVMEKIYDPGTGYAARVAEAEAARKRLRDDRAAGLYVDEDDAEWFRAQYARLGQEIRELRALPERPAGMQLVPTGQTIADHWATAPDGAARRELLHGYGVRVTLWPRGAGQRWQATGLSLHDLLADHAAPAEA
ncbi:recombinase family protein [Streptomyces sp. NPDC021020]|uniref:recombinase family protein n=1 Tax=Streptomyces sp. NPDC021020 TaxID=3365109 RepID=UPI0037B0D277